MMGSILAVVQKLVAGEFLVFFADEFPQEPFQLTKHEDGLRFARKPAIAPLRPHVVGPRSSAKRPLSGDKTVSAPLVLSGVATLQRLSQICEYAQF